MIVDSSALVAVGHKEDGFERILTALMTGPSIIPAPVLVEFNRVVTRGGRQGADAADMLLSSLLDGGAQIEPFTADDAALATIANQRFGTGNGCGGTLNMLDLMVYAIARRMNEPILCTGRDFAATDAAIHPASRTEGPSA